MVTHRVRAAPQTGTWYNTCKLMNPRRIWNRYPAVRWIVILGVVAAAIGVAVMLSMAGPPEDNPGDPASIAAVLAVPPGAGYAAWSDWPTRREYRP